MKNINKQRRPRKNNSTPPASQKLLDTLREIMYNRDGTVQYYFIEPRILFDEKNPKGKIYQRKSILRGPINEALFTNERGRKRNLSEVLNVFRTIQHDLGASYFILST